MVAGVSCGMALPQFPYVVKRGSVKVTIYYGVNKRGYRSFTLAYYQDGVRKRPVFSNFKEAKKEAIFVAERMGSQDADVLELKSADRAAYQRARQLLDPIGVGVEMAAAQFADAKIRLGNVPLSTAVDFYLQRYPKEPAPRTVQTVVDEFVDSKEIDGVSHVYLKHLRYHLGKFAARFKGNVGDVTGAEIDDWLRGAGWSLRTRNNLRTVLGTLFNFAKGRRYLPRDHSELDAVPVVRQPVGKIEVFTPAEMVEVLCFTEARMIPFMVLGAFAGVRHSEILRLEWKEVRVDEGLIEVTAAKAKTASRRLVPIVDNLRDWLVKYRRDEGPVCELLSAAPEVHDVVVRINQARLKAWEKRQLDVQAASGGISALAEGLGSETPGPPEDFQPFRWRQNVLRHSFISYRVAMVQNVDQVALEAGNSRQMVFSNYRELVTPKAAREWFAITPNTVEQAKAASREGTGAGSAVTGSEVSGGAAGAGDYGLSGVGQYVALEGMVWRMPPRGSGTSPV